jgi:hypothetical protein
VLIDDSNQKLQQFVSKAKAFVILMLINEANSKAQSSFHSNVNE